MSDPNLLKVERALMDALDQVRAMRDDLYYVECESCSEGFSNTPCECVRCRILGYEA